MYCLLMLNTPIVIFVVLKHVGRVGTPVECQRHMENHYTSLYTKRTRNSYSDYTQFLFIYA